MSIFHKDSVNNLNKSVANNILKSIIAPKEEQQKESIVMTQEVFDEALEKGVITSAEDIPDDNLEKGVGVNRSGLQKKVITDKSGNQRTVWVRTVAKKSGHDKEESFADKSKKFREDVSAKLDASRKEKLTDKDEKEVKDTYNKLKNHPESKEYTHRDIIDHIRKLHKVSSTEADAILKKHNVERHKDKV